MAGKTKTPNKRAPFQPTPHDRQMVKSLSGYGVPQAQICALIVNPATGKAIDEKTLRKAFADEIAAGIATANAKLGEMAYRQAVGSPAEYDRNGRKLRDEIKPVPVMTIFMAKVRLGFKETTALELGDAGGGPMELKVRFVKPKPDGSN